MRKFLSCAAGAVVLIGAVVGAVGCKPHTGAARTRYEITGEYLPDGHKLVATVSVTVPNSTDTALESLSFELWANAYREGALYPPVSALYSPTAYYAGQSYGGMSITSVEGAASFSVCGEDENILSVSLQEPLYPDEETTLTMSYEVTLANVNHRLGIGRRNINLSYFYPVLCARGESGFLEYVYSSNGDPFVNECADYRVELTFPSEYAAAYNGVGETVISGDKKISRFSADNVRDVAVVLGRDLKCLSGEANGIPVEYWYVTDSSPARTLKAATDSISYYSETFGDYGYPRFAVVQTDFPYGGMEYSGLAMISTDLISSDIPAVVAHETAHQWWYAMVGNNQFEHSWLDEGLAEYSAALFSGQFPEYGESYEQCVKRSEQGYRAFFSVKSQVSGEADTTMNRPLTAYSGEYEYRNIAYDKGVILLDRVRALIGDRAFFAALKTYCREYSGKLASPADLVSCFGGNAEELFRSFTDGKCVI